MTITAVPRTPADMQRIARAVDGVFTGSYADAWENKALPSVLDSRRTTADISTIASAVGGGFQKDDVRYAALMTTINSDAPAKVAAADVRAVDRAFTGSYADQWEVKSLPLVLRSPMGAQAPTLVDAIGAGFQKDDVRFAALDATIHGPRVAADAAKMVRGVDAAFSGSYADQWESKTVSELNASPRSGADIATIGEGVSSAFQKDDVRHAALTLGAAAMHRPAREVVSVLRGLDALFTGSYADQWEIKAASRVIPSSLAGSVVVEATRAAASMASKDDQRYAALETILARSGG